MAQESVFAPWEDPSQKPLIQFQNVTKRFGDFTAIDDLTLDIFEQEFFALLGPSGCGKTTLMRMLGGFETPTTGTIKIAGQDMNNVPPNKRAVNMMFQSYALFPHLSIYENIAFGLRRTDMAKDAIDTRVSEMLKLTRLEKFARRKPHQISGGQRQRVALARSLAKAPKLLLLDEPLGALDKKLRQDTQFELMDIQEKTGTTFVIVTHDQEEAMTVASRVAVMDEGLIIQVATPSEIYEAPNSCYVADFIGDVNLIKGMVEPRPEPVKPAAEPASIAPSNPAKPPEKTVSNWLTERVIAPIKAMREAPQKLLPAPNEAELESTKPEPETGGIQLNWSEGDPAIIVQNGDPEHVGTILTFAIRPEKLNISKTRPEADNALQGKVIDIAYLGNVSTYHVELADGTMIKAQMTNARRLARRDITWEDDVWVSFTATAGVLLEK